MRKHRERGFSLLELLAVIALIAILLGLYTGVIQKAYRFSVEKVTRIFADHNEMMSNE